LKLYIIDTVIHIININIIINIIISSNIRKSHHIYIFCFNNSQRYY